jgi:hypothetical protein
MKPGPSIWIAIGVLTMAACWAIDAPAQQPPPPTDTAQEPPTEQTPPEGQPSEVPPPADDDQQPPRTPAQPSAEDIIRQFQQELPAAVPVLPTGEDDEITIRADSEDAALGARPRLPDGYMLNDRTGRLGQEGEWWIFIFEADNPSYPEPPMKLLPCQTLERMVRESRGGLDPVIFIVSGEITDFRGENYLLPRKVLRKRDLGNLRK